VTIQRRTRKGWRTAQRLLSDGRDLAVAVRRLAEQAHGAGPVLARFADWAGFTVLETFRPANAGLAGRLVGDIARERDEDPFDTLIGIAWADELLTRFQPPRAGLDDRSWELRAEVWRDPRVVMGGTDAGAHLDMSVNAATTMLLGDVVRERQLLSLGQQLAWPAAWRAFAIEQRALVEQLPQLDAELGRIAAPTVIVAGAHDRIVPAAAAMT